MSRDRLRAQWMLALPVLGLCAAPAQAQPRCSLEQVVSLDMRTLPDGRVTVPMTLMGREYQLMVDTGGYVSVIDNLVAAELKLEPRTAGTRMVGLGTTMLNKYVTIPEIALGPLPGRNFQFYVGLRDTPGYSGILAPHIMAAYDTELDFAAEKFSLFRPNRCSGALSYWADHGYEPVPFRITNTTHITLELQIGGQEIDAIMDTGAAHTLIGMRDARRYLGIKENDPALKSLGFRTINGVSDEVFTYPFPELKFGGVTVTNPRIEIVSDRVAKNFRMIVGMGILRQLHMYIAYGDKKLHVTPALERKKPQ